MAMHAGPIFGCLIQNCYQIMTSFDHFKDILTFSDQGPCLAGCGNLAPRYCLGWNHLGYQSRFRWPCWVGYVEDGLGHILQWQVNSVGESISSYQIPLEMGKTPVRCFFYLTLHNINEFGKSKQCAMVVVWSDGVLGGISLLLIYM